MNLEERATGITAVVGVAAVFALLLIVGFSGILDRISMREQPAIQPMEPSEYFPDQQSARPLPDGTVARGHGPEQIESPRAADYASGRDRPRDREELEGPGEFPVPVDRAFIDRGQQQFEIYCAPCHGRSGHGDGIIVQRGMVSPPSFHIDRLRTQSPKYFYDIITQGVGRMFSYASRVNPRDRWAIAAYIEALQMSQAAPVERLEGRDRRQLGGSP